MDAPVEVRVLRAVIRQSLHEFGPALEDLRSAVEREPRHVGAWRTKASVHLVRGEFEEARRCVKGCAGAGDVGGAIVLAAQLSALDGDAAEAARMLEGWLGSPASARVGTEDRAWALGVLGEMRWRMGRVELAESAFREGLKETPSDPYLMAALSDLLLGAGRVAEVVELLKPYERMDGLLLRLAEAGRAMGHAEFGRWRSELESRFGKAQERGDRVHLREEARFRLRVCGDAMGAAELAEENWQVQREPSDLALLMEAGRASGDARVIALAREWMRDRKGAWGLGMEVGL
jgi:tetratricopeptide (TPR) repeat protein